MPKQEKCGAEQSSVPRVLVWPSWWYPNRLAPLSGIFIRRQALAIAAFCPTAVLFVTPDPSLKVGHEVVCAKEDGLPTVRVYFRPASSAPWQAISNTLRFIAAAAAGRRALPTPFQAPDLVQVQITPTIGLILFLRLFWRQPAVVFSEHWSKYLLPPRRENPMRRWFINRFSLRCAAVTAVSEMLSRGMRVHGLRSTCWRVIGNVVDPEIFFAEKDKKPGQIVTILHVSSQNKMKNIAGIIRATAELSRRRSHIFLLIIGSGPSRAECEELARNKGLLEQVVFFQNPLPEKELAAVIRRGDILVLFSEFETFSCVAAEALASGLAVISTPTAVTEYLPEDSGILVPFNDEEALAAAIQTIADRMPEFDRAPGPRMVRERFAPQVIGRQFCELFREVLAKSRP